MGSADCSCSALVRISEWQGVFPFCILFFMGSADCSRSALVYSQCTLWYIGDTKHCVSTAPLLNKFLTTFSNDRVFGHSYLIFLISFHNSTIKIIFAAFLVTKIFLF